MEAGYSVTSPPTTFTTGFLVTPVFVGFNRLKAYRLIRIGRRRMTLVVFFVPTLTVMTSLLISFAMLQNFLRLKIVSESHLDVSDSPEGSGIRSVAPFIFENQFIYFSPYTLDFPKNAAYLCIVKQNADRPPCVRLDGRFSLSYD